VVLTDTPEVVLDSPGYRSNLTEPTGVTSCTDTPVAVDAVLTGGSVLTDVRSAVVYVVCTVLTRVAARTVASTDRQTK